MFVWLTLLCDASGLWFAFGCLLCLFDLACLLLAPFDTLFCFADALILAGCLILLLVWWYLVCLGLCRC